MSVDVGDVAGWTHLVDLGLVGRRPFIDATHIDSRGRRRNLSKGRSCVVHLQGQTRDSFEARGELERVNCEPPTAEVVRIEEERIRGGNVDGRWWIERRRDWQRLIGDVCGERER